MTDQLRQLCLDRNIDWDKPNQDGTTHGFETDIDIKSFLQNEFLYKEGNSDFVKRDFFQKIETIYQKDDTNKERYAEFLSYLFDEIFSTIQQSKLTSPSISEDSTESDSVGTTVSKNKELVLLKFIKQLVEYKTDLGEFSHNLLTSYCSSVNVDDSTLSKLWSMLDITTDDRMYHIKRLLLKDTTAISKYRKVYKKICTHDPRYDLLEEAVGWSDMINLVLAGVIDDQIIFSENPLVKLHGFYIPAFETIMSKYQLKQTGVLEQIVDIMILSLGHALLTESNVYFDLFCSDSWKFCLLLLEYINSASSVKLANIDKLDVEGGNMVISNVLVERINSKKELANPSSDSSYLSNCLQVTCILLKSGLVSFQSIYSGLQPLDDGILVKYFDYYVSELKQIKKETTSSANALATAQALSNEDDHGAKLISTNASSFGLKNTQEIGVTSSDSAVKNDANTEEDEKTKVKKEIVSKAYNCSKLLFLEKLLETGCYTPAVYLLKKFKQAHFQNPLLMTLSFRMFDEMISPLHGCTISKQFTVQERSLPRVSYNDVMLVHSAQQMLLQSSSDPLDVSIPPYLFQYYFPKWNERVPVIDTVDLLFKYSHEFLFLLSPRLDYEGGEHLLQKIVAIALDDISANNQRAKEWFVYFRKFLFPSMIFNTGSINNQLFRVMKHFSVGERFVLYNELTTRLLDSNLNIKLQYAKTESGMKNFLKVVSYEKVESQCRRFANYANSNPLAVFDFVLATIENFDKVSSILVSASKFLTPFALDVLEFSLLKRLTQPRETISADGVNMAQWFQNLTNFIANIIKQQPLFRCSSIIEYILNNLSKGDYSASFLLKTIIDNVSGIQPLEDVQEDILIMLNSGNFLKTAARNNLLDMRERNTKTSVAFFQNFELCSSNSISLIILYLQKYLKNVFDSDFDEKIISNRYDDVSSILWRFIEFCNHIIPEKDYAQFIFSFVDMIDQHDMDMSWAFHLWRSHLSNDRSSPGQLDAMMGSRRLVDTFGDNIEFFADFWLGSLKDVLYSEPIYSSSSKYKSNSSEAEIQQDKNEHSVHTKEFFARLQGQKTKWSLSINQDQAYNLLVKCIIPRAQFGLEDAYYCAEFLFAFFDKDEVILLLDTLFDSDLFAFELASLTSASVAYFGLFIKKCMEKILDMKDLYGKDDILSKTVLKWSTQFTNVISCFIGSDVYMFSRNCIQLMSKVVFTFPIFRAHVSTLVNSVQCRLKNEQRNDIRTPCETLLGFLKTQLNKTISVLNYCELSETELELYTVMENSTEMYQQMDSYRQSLLKLRREDELELLRKKKAEEEEIARQKAEEEALAKKKADDEAAAQRKLEEDASAKKRALEEEAENQKKKEEADALAAKKKEALEEEIRKKKEHLEETRKRLLKQDIPTAPKKPKLDIDPNDKTDYQKMANDILDTLAKDELQGDGVGKIVTLLKDYNMYTKLTYILKNSSNDFAEKYTGVISFTLRTFFRTKIPDTFEEFSNKLKFIIESNYKRLGQDSRNNLVKVFEQMQTFMEQYKTKRSHFEAKPAVGRTKVSESTASVPTNRVKVSESISRAPAGRVKVSESVTRAPVGNRFDTVSGNNSRPSAPASTSRQGGSLRSGHASTSQGTSQHQSRSSADDRNGGNGRYGTSRSDSDKYYDNRGRDSRDARGTSNMNNQTKGSESRYNNTYRSSAPKR